VEKAAVAVVRFLAILDLPVSLFAILVGLITAVRSALRSDVAVDFGLVERIAVGLCGGVAFLGFFGLIETLVTRRPDFPPLAMVFAVCILALSWPAFAWKSRWRGVAEGVATICVAIAAILSGFTIGFMFVPLVLLMIWVCFLRLFAPFRDARGGASARVDSPV
jgi:hypothetical protein